MSKQNVGEKMIFFNFLSICLFIFVRCSSMHVGTVTNCNNIFGGNCNLIKISKYNINGKIFMSKQNVGEKMISKKIS